MIESTPPSNAIAISSPPMSSKPASAPAGAANFTSPIPIEPGFQNANTRNGNTATKAAAPVAQLGSAASANTSAGATNEFRSRRVFRSSAAATSMIAIAIHITTSVLLSCGAPRITAKPSAAVAVISDSGTRRLNP